MADNPQTIYNADLAPLSKIASGKIREIYQSPKENELLFVTTDRISAFDVVMKNTIPNKGAILTHLSSFWFSLLSTRLPNLKTHFLSTGLPPSCPQFTNFPDSDKPKVDARTMQVRKLKVLPIESIVRGHIAGTAWASYQRDGTMNGVELEKGLRESQELSEPVWTPSTKAEVGGKDENVSKARAKEIIKEFIGDERVSQPLAFEMEVLSILVFKTAREYAAERGIIIADTKFEWAIDESVNPPALVLVDEVLTPDSSRFWSTEKFEVGRGQDSFDKQYLRDWLLETKQKGKEGVEMPQEVVVNTEAKYREAFRILTGKESQS